MLNLMQKNSTVSLSIFANFRMLISRSEKDRILFVRVGFVYHVVVVVINKASSTLMWKEAVAAICKLMRTNESYTIHTGCFKTMCIWSSNN